MVFKLADNFVIGFMTFSLLDRIKKTAVIKGGSGDSSRGKL